MKSITVPAELDRLDEVLDFINAELEAHDASIKAQTQIDIAAEEIYVNIAHYAYKPVTGEATISCEVGGDPLSVTITFLDNGKPFNPLELPDPDVTLAASERKIGGLGIYMVKKSMDEIAYRYDDGRNILSIKKSI